MPLVRKTPGSEAAPSLDAAAVASALENGSEDERWAAARKAPELPEGAMLLGKALLQERDARVREAMLTSLARIATAESVEAVIPLLRSDDAQMRTGALDALRAMKDAAWPFVPRLLADRDADVRLLACELARDQPGEEASRLLCGLLDTETEPNVCASAVEVLAGAGGAEALPALERCKERFKGTPFLEYAIKITADRIRSQTTAKRA
jgi:HEAT repeat protein